MTTTTSSSLSATLREGTGKGVARKLRQDGKIPGVVYGKDMETVQITLDAHDAMHLFQSISVENTIVDLQVEGHEEALPTLVREIQMHPFRNDIIHIDFLRIQAGVAVDVDVPVNLDGIPAGVRTGGGTLEQIIHELPVRCIPSKIPQEFVVDVTGLEIGDTLHVSDIELGEGVELTISAEQTLCSVAAPRVEEEAEEEELELVEGEIPEGEPTAEGDEAEGEGDD